MKRGREQTKILVDYSDSVASHMERQLGAGKSCTDKVIWLWMRQGIGNIEFWNDVLWILTNLMGMNLVSVLCSSQKKNHGDVHS